MSYMRYVFIIYVSDQNAKLICVFDLQFPVTT